MNRVSKGPNPRKDFLGAIAYLIELEECNAERLDRLEKKSRDIREIREEEWLSVADIAKDLGCGESTVRTRPWDLPGFGQSERAGRKYGWKASTYAGWKARPREERIREWNDLPDREKMRIRGVRAA